jgi:hypothetical protein
MLREGIQSAGGVGDVSCVHARARVHVPSRRDKTTKSRGYESKRLRAVRRLDTDSGAPSRRARHGPPG